MLTKITDTQSYNTRDQFSPETQDSEVSGQNEAPVRSELMEEAKLKADVLVELYSQFEFKVKRFPEKVRKHNRLLKL